MRWLLTNLLWAEGWLPLVVIGACGLAAWLMASRFLAVIAVCALLFSLYFFRNPERSCPEAQMDGTLIVCPADGKVVEIAPVSDPYVGDAWKIAIFLSPFDVHVNWVPQTGCVEEVLYRPGKFLVAYAPKSSEINERNDIQYRMAGGARCVVRQIAGFVARRIACWVQRGDRCEQGTKYGMIRFGSRVELFLPRSTHLYLEEGQRVYGGATIVGRLL